jgi:tetratricopeptide (TPR) repeat protein
LAPSLGAAQTRQDGTAEFLGKELFRQAIKEPDNAAELRMNEDIEVMRRLLDTALQRLMQSTIPVSRAAAGKTLWSLADGTVRTVDPDSPGGSADAWKLWLGTGDGWAHGNKEKWFSYPKDGQWPTFTELAAQAVDPHAGLYRSAMLESTEGTYLKGYGIVFSASVPASADKTVAEAAKPARKPLSDWERVRKELRGEKMEADDQKKEEPHRVSLTDTLLKVLAENGQHITYLADNEQITVALTLRDPKLGSQACLQCHQVSATGTALHHYGLGRVGGMPGGTVAAAGAPSTGGAAPPATGEKAGDGTGGASPAPGAQEEVVKKALEFIRRTKEQPESEAYNEALLGDLYFKQGKYKEAIAAYQKAIQIQRKALEDRRRVELDLQGHTSVDAKSHLKAVELYTKLAQSFLAANEPEQALKTSQEIGSSSEALLKAYRDLVKQQAAVSSRSERSPAIPLPAKLIISAPKKLLDEVGSGKMRFEDFKKAATVQRVNFPAGKEQPAKPNG